MRKFKRMKKGDTFIKDGYICEVLSDTHRAVEITKETKICFDSGNKVLSEKKNNRKFKFDALAFAVGFLIADYLFD